MTWCDTPVGNVPLIPAAAEEVSLHVDAHLLVFFDNNVVLLAHRLHAFERLGRTIGGECLDDVVFVASSSQY